MRFPRPRFSLLALLLAFAVLAGWLGYQRYVIDQRRAALVWIKQQWGNYQEYSWPLNEPSQPYPAWFREKVEQVSSVRVLLGDPPVYYISLVHSTASWEDRQRIAALFPEASVVPEHPEGFHRGDQED